MHENCLADNQGILCGACHNILLHDSSSNHYSNTLIYSAGNNAVAYNICVKIGKKEDFHDMSCVDIQVSPDVEDIMKANKCKILLPTQWVWIQAGGGSHRHALVIWNSGTNIKILSKQMAETASWKWFPSGNWS